MKKILITHLLPIFILFSTFAHSQCTVEVNSQGFEYNVTTNLNISGATFTQSGSTCNVNINVDYDIEIDLIDQPSWSNWNETLYTLQGVFDCEGASGTSFFQLPNNGGIGSSTSATFSYNNTMCEDIVLDCPITLQIAGPGLGNSTYDCGLYLSATLPVDLRDFSISQKDKAGVSLDWVTDSEINFSHFEVQTSYDTQNWDFIDKVYSTTRNIGAEYSYGLLAMAQDRYVRLKMVDLDGQFDYSPILFIEGSTDTKSITVYPNPTSDRLFITGIHTDHVLIINAMGQRTHLSVINNSVDVSSLQAGSYILQNIDGQNRVSKRFIKL